MPNHLKSLTALIISSASILASCDTNSKSAANNSDNQSSTDTSKADKEWIYLFDGKNLDGWRAYNGESLPDNWVLEDGTLKSLGQGGDLGGDIVYGDREFEDFELVLEWKISEGGNSGVFYHVVEGEQYDAPYENAPEYQMIDDIGFPEELEEWQQVGADYGMYTPDPDKKKKIIKKAGEWNTTRIKFEKDKAEYWLNGEKLLEFDPWSEEWSKRKAEGKWKDYPDYGKARKGLIGLQDHGSFIWFRDIKVREL